MGLSHRLLLLSCIALPSLAHAQATSTASKTTRLSVFGGVSRVSTDYNSQEYGFTVGGDVTHHFHLLDGSLEARYTRATGDPVSESSFAGGIKAEKAYRSFHPYVDLLIGQGNITFIRPIIYPTGPYAGDNSIIYVAGAGLDYDITPRFALKLDGQIQSWKVGSEAARLTPSAITLGVVYRIPFKALRGR
jgi:hypothetical protein